MSSPASSVLAFRLLLVVGDWCFRVSPSDSGLYSNQLTSGAEGLYLVRLHRTAAYILVESSSTADLT